LRSFSDITRERDQERERVRLATEALAPNIRDHAYYNLMGVQTDLEWHFDGIGPITKADHTTVTRVIGQIVAALEALPGGADKVQDHRNGFGSCQRGHRLELPRRKPGGPEMSLPFTWDRRPNGNVFLSWPESAGGGLRAATQAEVELIDALERRDSYAEALERTRDAAVAFYSFLVDIDKFKGDIPDAAWIPFANSLTGWLDGTATPAATATPCEWGHTTRIESCVMCNPGASKCAPQSRYQKGSA
jgi:hypothetical protein